MSDPEVENMLLELESEIFALKLDDVSNLANKMKIDKSSVEGKSQFSIQNLYAKRSKRKWATWLNHRITR